MTRSRCAVLISGRGSNLAALMAAAEDPDYPTEIVLVISNRADAGGLALAAARGVPTMVIDHRAFVSKAAFETDITATLRDYKVELVCLAGFMRLLSPHFVAVWRNRLINIHPSLLPGLPGLHTHERALAAGVKVHGATVHYVRAETDAGPIIAQGALCVLPDDTPETLAARVLEIEHRLYPLALQLVASGAVQVIDERVAFESPEAQRDAALLVPTRPGA